MPSTVPETTGMEQIAIEQAALDLAYDALDSTRHSYRIEQAKIQQQGAWGTPQNRTERDALAAHFGDEAARLEQVDDRLMFGRLDMEDTKKRYIGRVGLRDDNDVQILLDWRAPAAQPFYQATAATPFSVVRRRHISTHNRRVIALEDELLSTDGAEDSPAMQVQGEGSLLAAISLARDGRMSDIVATIQAEQDAIIRTEFTGPVVVQGGPGTGKTAVALHRAAYMLYAHRERLEKAGVLIVGPSPVFLRYIERVLPALGETGVVSLTMADLLPHTRATGSESPEITQLKGRPIWAEIAQRAVRSLQRIPQKPITVLVQGKEVVIDADTVRQAMSRARRHTAPHNEAWATYALAMVSALTKQYVDYQADLGSEPWWQEDIRQNIDIRRTVNLHWLPMSATQLLAKLYARPDLLAQHAPEFTSAERQQLYRPLDSPWTVADIPILDELEELLGPLPSATGTTTQQQEKAQARAELKRAHRAISSQGLGGGLVSAEMLAARNTSSAPETTTSERARRDRAWTYGHIVVDEAQELSPMAWRTLVRRCPSRSFTIVGDLAQSSQLAVASSWPELLDQAFKTPLLETSLSICYRTPTSIMDAARRVLEAEGQKEPYALRCIRDLPNALAYTHTSTENLVTDLQAVAQTEIAKLDQELGSNTGKIGVIAPQNLIETCQKALHLSASADPLLDRISVHTVWNTKGLEFDTVILVEPSQLRQFGPGSLYVAMTRPTRKLHTIYTTDLPEGFIP